MSEPGGTVLADKSAEPERVGKFTPPRQAVVDLLRRRLEEKLQDVEGGPWDGIRVVTAKDLDEALGEALPPASLFSAEVRTPGWVTVAAVCPRCEIATDVSLDVKAELLVDGTGAEIRLKGKSKARTHVCGQTTIAEAASQDSFELADIVGDQSDEDGEADGHDEETEGHGAGEG